jgi:hypothetical protein
LWRAAGLEMGWVRAHIIWMTQNPYKRRAKIWFLFSLAMLIPMFLLSLGRPNATSLVANLIPPLLVWLGGVVWLLWKAYR